MHWYEGGIAEAVTLSRTKNAVFVVYIQGEDDQSKSLTEIIDTAEVTGLLESDAFVAIKLEAGSVPHQQFSEIYKQTTTPSIYFIGKTGTPLEILTEVKDAADVIDKIGRVVIRNGGSPLKFKSEDLMKSEGAGSTQIKSEASELKPMASSSKEPEKMETAPTAVGGEGVVEVADSTTAETEDDKGGLTTEDKLKLAQDLIEKKRAQKKIEDEEKEKLKEVERRKMGHDVQKMKRWQQDQEMKQIMEERQREKREEQEARDKVKRQIEEDKREKAARLAAAATQPVAPVDQPKQPPSRPMNVNTARLQMRLPDGSAHTHDFNSSAVLQEVIDYINQNVRLTFANFVLSTTFPRREFSANDASQSLLDLQLVPNAVILILPVAHGAVATNTGDGLMGMLWYILAPLLNFFGYLKGLVWGTAPTETRTLDNKRTSDSVELSEGPSRPAPKRRAAGEAAIKRQGNIHRLTDRESDDDNNTWNGNSTQQM